ncbi:MAG: SusC/RagA family TonB-linked outer membrane protein, partial [Candidatus Cryptobacteroides sp.]
AISDDEGMYSISVPADAVLKVDMMSYESRTIPVKGKTKLNISMTPSSYLLEDAVSIGYGYVKKSDLASAISVIGQNEINKTAVTSIDQALQGNAAGVLVMTASAEPGGDVTMRIRGSSSISGSTEPLIVIDNIISDQTAMTMLSPSDVMSIEVLKDAAATAIYGSRGANGVVMITTKSGVEGKAQLNIGVKYGISTPRYEIEMMDSPQYAEYDNLGRMSWGVSSFNTMRPDTLSTTNFQEQLLRDMAQYQEYNVSVKGGNKGMRYYVSGGYLNQTGILKNSSNDRLTFRTKFNIELAKNLHLDIGAAVSNQKTEKVSSGGSGATIRMLMLKPTQKLNGTSTGDGMYLDEETGEWKVINQEASKSMNSNQWNHKFTADFNAQLRWNIGKYWTFTSTGSYKYLGSEDYGYVLRSIYTSEANIDKNNTAKRSTSKSFDWSNENYFNYARKFNSKHYFDWMIGQSWSETKKEGFGISVTRFDTDYYMWDNLAAGAYVNAPSSSKSRVSHLSFFTRASYRLMDRYTFTVLMRADGSSRFGADRKFGYFPAASFAWNMKKEKWLKNVKGVTELKPRFSWGITGNDRIGEYQSMSLLSSNKIIVNGQVYNGFTNSQIGNDKLQWETTHEYNLGIDAGFVKNRIKFSIEGYYKQTYNLLYSYQLPLTTGYSKVMANVGNIDNRGVEFDITTRNIETKNFYWTTSLNIGYNQSRVTDLGGNDNVVMFYLGDNVNQNLTYLRIGQPMGVIMGYETSVYQDWDDVYDDKSVWVEDPAVMGTRPGMLKYVDQNNDGVIDDNDKVVLGKALHPLNGGFTNTFSWKGITLTAFFNFSFGGKIVNSNVTKLEQYAAGNNNSYKYVLDCYRPANPIIGDSGYKGGYYPLPTSYSSPSSARLYTSNIIDKWVQDGSYIRLKTLSLAYTFPEKLMRKIYVRNLTLGVSLQNFFTWTKYKGYDPECSSSLGTSNSKIGVDYSSYPAVKTVMFNLSLNF